MLMVMLGLTFGTGLPLVYGITAVSLLFQGVVDRHALMRCKVSSRYDADLPRLMIGECHWIIIMMLSCSDLSLMVACRYTSLRGPVPLLPWPMDAYLLHD